MFDVGRTVLGLILATTSVVAADTTPTEPMDRIWPALPADHSLSLEDRITDNMTDLGNRLGGRLDVMTHDMMGLHVDGRGNRARLRLGGGNVHYLTLRLDSDWHFGDGKARVNARIKLGLAGHVLEIQLPAMDVSRDSYRGEQLVQVNVPLLERRF